MNDRVSAQRLRRWVQGEHSDTDVAADARVVLDELDELFERAEEVRRAWVCMPPNPRTTVRAQSSDLYDALGALSTFVSVRQRAR